MGRSSLGDPGRRHRLRPPFFSSLLGEQLTGVKQGIRGVVKLAGGGEGREGPTKTRRREARGGLPEVEGLRVDESVHSGCPVPVKNVETEGRTLSREWGAKGGGEEKEEEKEEGKEFG